MQEQKFKSNVFMILIFIAFVVVAGIILTIVGTLSDNITTELIESDILDSSSGNESLQEIKSSIIPIHDNMYLWFFFGLIISLIVVAVFTDYHPVTIGIFLFIILFAIFLTMQGANIMDDLKTETDSELKTGKGFSLRDAVSGKVMPSLIFIFSILALIIIYSKRNQGGSFG